MNSWRRAGAIERCSICRRNASMRISRETRRSMKPSPDATPPTDADLPRPFVSMWRLFKLGYRHERRLMITALALSQLAALPDALLALWLMLLGKAVLEQRPVLALMAAAGLGVSAAGTWVLTAINGRVQRRFRSRITIVLEAHVARMQASIATLAHQERPDYLNRLAMLRDQIFALDHMYLSIFSTLGWFVRLGVTLGLLAAIHPALLL